MKEFDLETVGLKVLQSEKCKKKKKSGSGVLSGGHLLQNLYSGKIPLEVLFQRRKQLF